jgi:hypothetical protein
MLSERDAQALRSIEEQLTADDPAFAARMAGKRSGCYGEWAPSPCILTITVALAFAALFLMLRALGPILIAMSFACVLFGLRSAWLARRWSAD